MPRRNHNPRHKGRRSTDTTAEKPPSYQQMAHALVNAGICSPRILGPRRNTQPATTPDAATTERHDA